MTAWGRALPRSVIGWEEDQEAVIGLILGCVLLLMNTAVRVACLDACFFNFDLGIIVDVVKICSS